MLGSITLWCFATLLLALGLLSGSTASAVAQAGPADMVLRNGKFVTVDERMPEAEAMAILGDRILDIGTDAEMGAYIGPETEVVDLGGSSRFRDSSRATGTSSALETPPSS